jgi:hypothetical protein
MLRSIFRHLTAAAAVFFVALLIFAVPSFFAPEFELVNRSSEAVSVVAAWRSNEKRIERIDAMSSYRFVVGDEAAMTFTVRYPNGKEVESEPLYFTRGIKVIATITDDGIDARYEHEI